MLAELRFLHERRPDLSADAILRMATMNGATALGWQQEVGSLNVGKSADLVIVPLSGARENPVQSLLEGKDPVRAVCIRGEWMVGADAARSA
jgi:5-methylthioadenosine/S-adenosylhomocysteine deaminase